MKTKNRTDYIDSGIPRSVIETAIIIMAASAILSCSPISNWMSARIPWVQALVDTAGMVLVYYAYHSRNETLAASASMPWVLSLNVSESRCLP